MQWFNRGFLSLIVTQFFGAANDNVLKGVLTFMVIDGAWSGRLGPGGQGVVGLCFTVPFILLSGYAGQFADRNSKRSVSVLLKVLEIPIAGIALVGFWFGNLWVSLGAMIALTCQSAYFGPAKYGMIPELVPDAELSRANGIINMMTNIAVILGTLIAGIVSDRYSPVPGAAGAPAVNAPMLWLPGVVMLVIAAAGLASVLFMTKLTPGDPDLEYHWDPFRTYVEAIRDMGRTPLLMVMLAWGYFYLLAGLGLLIVPEYTVVLQISREKASQLLGIMAIAIGVGSVMAGLISGRHIRPILIPIGAAGITVFFFLLGVVPATFTRVAVLIAGAGFFAGFYIIPLQAMLQALSPDDERGRFLGTANAVSFGFLSVASLLYMVIKPIPIFRTQPDRIFLVSAALMAAGAAYFMIAMRATFRDATTKPLP